MKNKEVLKELRYRVSQLEGTTNSNILPSRDEIMVQLRLEGFSYPEIAEHYGITKQRAHQIIQNKVPSKSIVKGHAALDLFKELQDGKTLQKIAQNTGRTCSKIWRLKEWGSKQLGLKAPSSKIPEETRREIIRMYMDNMRLGDISKKTGYRIFKIQRILRQSGIKLFHRKGLKRKKGESCL